MSIGRHSPRVVAALGITFVASAFGLELLHPGPDSVLARLLATELVHLVGHTLLYAALAAALAYRWVPDDALTLRQPDLRRRAAIATATFMLVAVAQELAQAVGRGRLLALESLFDLAVDFTAGAAGVIAWAHLHPARGRPAARALRALLHPGLLGPLGVFTVTFAGARDAGVAAGWTAVAAATALLATGWTTGVRRGPRRRPPGPHTAVVTSGAALLWVGVTFVGAPAIVRETALCCLSATVLGSTASRIGLEVSAHTIIPVAVLALLVSSTERGLWPFAVAALAVAWAHLRDGRLTTAEVLAAWGIAGASGLLPRLA